MVENIFFVIQVLGIVGLLVETVYVACQKPSVLQLELLFMTVSSALMAFGYLLEITASTEDAAILGTAVSYLGKPYVMLSSLLFILTFCGYRIPRKFTISVFSYLLLFPFLVFTNDYHHLYYATVGFDGSRHFSTLILTHGPFYYLYLATTVVYFVACVVITVREYGRAQTKTERMQITILMAMVVFGVAGYAVFLTGITGGYDSTMMGCFLGVGCLALLFHRYKLFDVLTLAKDQALNDAANGLIVFDTRGHVIYSNALIRNLLADGVTTMKEITDLSQGDSDTVQVRGRSVYRVIKKKIEKNGRSYGATVEVSDITESYWYASRLEVAVEARTRDILHIQRTVVASFANIVEARDGGTGLHVKRTSEVVSLIAAGFRSLGLHTGLLTRDYIDRLVDVAPLHDIGKLSVRDSILLKPGKLTAEEFEEMKRHAERGRDIIDASMRGVESDAYVELAEEVAYFHHEKWNGSGYPQGLKGEEIPLSARIMAIADVYDAVRSERCYKSAVDAETAHRIILEGEGSHFDPDAVRAFSLMLPEIEKIYQPEEKSEEKQDPPSQ